MPILDLQKRARELGRIRIGQVVPTKNGKTRPEKLDRFRLTSHSKPLLEKVAQLYGGTVESWDPQGGGASAWEVVTTTSRLPIMVPPQPVSQWYEFWTAGGCKHRCDGRTNVLTDELCDPEDYSHKQALERPTTRLNVVLRDVEGIGVWRLETHGWNAAVELPDAAQFLAQAGGYVNGWVSLEPRTSKAEVADRQNGGTKIETRHFMVPIIEIDVTPSELMAGRGRVQPAELGAGGPVPVTASEAPAIEAARPDYRGAANNALDLDAIRDLWRQAHEAGDLDEELQAYLTERGNALQAAPAPAPAPAADAAPAAGPDADAVWQQILKAGGERGMSLPDIEDAVAGFLSISSAEASGEELAMYLTELTRTAGAA